MIQLARLNPPNPTNPSNAMSSNMRIPKTCNFCQKEFIARKTSSKTCSDDCAKRLYKLKQRNKKIQQAIEENRNKRKSDGLKSIKELREVQNKELLTLNEAAYILNISPLTLRRWVLAEKIKSCKIGKRHVFSRQKLIAVFTN
jgi:excisionase family DNA binding protein